MSAAEIFTKFRRNTGTTGQGLSGGRLSMSRDQALQTRLSAIEAQLAQAVGRAPHRPRPPSSGRHTGLRHDALDQVSPALQGLLAEVLPGALVLDWRQVGSGHAGRMAADGLVFRFRVDAAGVAYAPAWDDVGQRGWELRSDSFLSLRTPAMRLDFRRNAKASGGQKRQCRTGYSCGSACISLRKECRSQPRSAIGKARLRRLQELAAAGDKTAAATAAQVQSARGVAGAEKRRARNAERVERFLARPEIAEFLRTGKVPSGANSSTEPGTVREMKPGEIAFDPSRFQYKLNATATTGEVGSLSGVRKWDPNLSGVMSVWKDPGDGKVYVINGHNRLALANRLGAEAVTVRFLNAANATEARAIGALQNIAEGAGSPMDAAKFFRDTGIKSQADVEARGLPLGSGQAEKGLKLSKLPPEVFNAVVRGDLSVNRGAIIGGSGLDEAKQREVFKAIGGRKGLADQTLLELVEHAAASVQRTQTTMNLFGESEETKDNLITRARLAAGVRGKIAREKRLFGTVSRAKAATSLTEKGGNVINQEQSARVASEASEALDVFKRLKSASGPISSALNRAADRVEAGESEAKVRKDLEQDVFAAVEAELVAAGLRKPRRADSLEARIDALRRKCRTGYSCGSACISLQKECRAQPRSAMGKERLRKLLALAQGEIRPRGIGVPKAAEAATMAAALQGRRTGQAQELRFQRWAARGVNAPQQKQGNPYRPTPQIKEGVTIKPMSIAAGGDTNYDPAAEKKKAAGGLKYYRTQRGGSTKQNYFFRDRQAAEHWYAEYNAKSDADAEAGTHNRRGKEWQAEYKASYVSTRNVLRDISDRELLVTVEDFAAAGTATRGGTATDVRIGGNTHSRPIREGTFAKGNTSEGPPQSEQAGPLRGARAQRKPADRSAEPELDPDEVAYLQVSTKSQFSSDRKTREELARRGVNLGSDPQKRLQQLGKSVREKLLGKDYYSDPDYKQKLRSFAKASEAITVTATTASVLSNPGRHDPGLAPRAKQQGLNAQDVATSSQQAAFARQQQQAAQAAGDQRGAQAWRKEERTAERDRLANAIAIGKQNQGSLFGVTEYDETMPLFQQQAGATGQNQPRAQQRPAGGAMVPSRRSAQAITPGVVNADVLPAQPAASRPGSIASTMRETLNAMKAADARQMGMVAEQLFETGWLLDRRTRYRGMSKDQAREQFKVEFMQKLQEGARSPKAAARREAMGRRAAEAGSVSGAMRSLLEDMKASDNRLNDLTRQAIDLRVGAEEQFGGEGGEDPGLGGGRPRRRIGGSRRRRDAADDRFDDAIERLAVLRARMDQRCRRPDGSHYGTSGDCRQGIRAGIARAVGQRIKGLGRRLLGRGQKGPNGDVMASAERIQQMAAARKKEEAERQAKEKAREEELLSRGPQKWGVKQVEKEEVRGSGDKGIVWHESRYEVQLEEPLRLSARPGKEPRLVDKLSFQVAVDGANAKPIARKLGEQGIKLSNGQVNNALELAWLTGAGGGEAFMGADRMELPKNVARRFAMEISKQVKGLVSNMEEGQIVICKAHQDDGYGDKRRSLYERAGFTFIDGTGIAVVRNGRLGRIEGARGDRLDAGDEIDLEGLLFALLTLGSSRRRDAAADILEARIDALRLQCIPLAR